MGALGGSATAGEKQDAVFVHAVFFELKQDDAQAVQALIDGCKKYLAPHEGIVFFSAMPRAVEKDRDVNDQDFDVALTIAFESEAAHDVYQTTDQHMAFIETLSENWESVRVFDSRTPASE